MDENIHPYVSEIVAAATLHKDATGHDRYALPAPIAKQIEARVRVEFLSELPLFVHLVVVASRLRRSGLVPFADQLAALAAIGLSEHTKPARAEPRPKAQPHALAPTHKTGVGLRPKHKR